MTEIADVILAQIELPRRYQLMEACMAREHVVLEEDPCNIAYPKVKETLEKLHKTHRLFIVSNSQSGYPQLLIEKLGIGHLIEGHLCFGDTGTCKGDTILTLMKNHNISDAVYIGDTQGDMEASYHAGLPFVFCRYGFGTPEKWDAEVGSFEQLLELFV